MSGGCRFMEREGLVVIGQQWFNSVLRRQQQTAGFIVSRSVIAAVSVMVALSASDVSANGEAGDCPPEWADYVSAVSDIIEPLGQDLPVIFVSREGEAFDCLGLMRNNQFLERASAFSRTWPFHRSPINLSDSGTWPINVCNVEASNLPHVPFFYAIHLPRQAEVLELPICRVRVTNAIRHFLGVNE